MKKYLFYVVSLASFSIFAQVGIGTITPNASLDIQSSNVSAPSNTDGLLIPKIDEFPASSPGAAQDGMMVYATGNGSVTKGFYYWDQIATAWTPAGGAKNINELADGRTDPDGGSLFLGVDSGSNDDQTFNSNIGIGINTLEANTSGEINIAIGRNTLWNNDGGSYNTAVGGYSMLLNTTGVYNVAFGNAALQNNVTGAGNVAIGGLSSYNSGTSIGNVSVGHRSLYHNSGSYNTGLGFSVGELGSGSQNVYIGGETAIRANGNNNVFLGFASGNYAAATTISNSVYIGSHSGRQESNSHRLYIENSNSLTPLIYGEFDNDVIGFNGNVAIGHQSPQAVLHVKEDGAVGSATIAAVIESDISDRPTLLFSENASINLNSGMSIEYDGTGTGGGNKLLINGVGGSPYFEFSNGGSLATNEGDLIIRNTGNDKNLRLADNTGNDDRVILRQNSTNDIYIGDIDDNNGALFFRAGGTSEMIIENGGQVGINTLTPGWDLEVNGTAAKPGGGSWINASDRRLKRNINSFEQGLETLLKIRPVSYQYNALSGFDSSKTHIGVVAQELQKIAPYMVEEYERENGTLLAVDSSAMTFLLINSVQSQQKQIKTLRQDIAELKELLKTISNE